MYTGKVGIRKTDIPNRSTRTWNKVDYSRRQSGFLQDLHDYVGCVYQRRSGFPNNRIPHQSRSCWQVSCDGCKIKWSNSKHKTFKWTVLYVIPYTNRRFRLLLVDLLGISYIEPKEIYEFTSCINFGLKCRFAAGKHRSGIHFCSVFCRNQFCRFEENCRPLLPTI